METSLPISIYSVGAVAQFKHAANRARRCGRQLNAATYFRNLPPTEMRVYAPIGICMRTKKGEYEMEVDPENVQWVSELFANTKSLMAVESAFDIVTDAGVSVTNIPALELHNTKFLKVVESRSVPVPVSVESAMPVINEFIQNVRETMSAHEIVNQPWVAKIGQVVATAPVLETEPLQPIRRVPTETVERKTPRVPVERKMPVKTEVPVERKMPPLRRINREPVMTSGKHHALPEAVSVMPALERIPDSVGNAVSWDALVDRYLENRGISNDSNVVIMKPSDNCAVGQRLHQLQEIGAQEALYGFMDGLVSTSTSNLDNGTQVKMKDNSTFQISEDGSSLMAVRGEVLGKPHEFTREVGARFTTLAFQ